MLLQCTLCCAMTKYQHGQGIKGGEHHTIFAPRDDDHDGVLDFDEFYHGYWSSFYLWEVRWCWLCACAAAMCVCSLQERLSTWARSTISNAAVGKLTARAVLGAANVDLYLHSCS